MMPLQKSNNKPNHKTFVFEAIGTKWVIDINQPLLKKESDFLLDKIQKRIEEFDKNYSRFRVDSLVTEMAQKTGHYKLPTDAKPMFDLYQKLYHLTQGLVTPLIGQTLEQTGYDASYTFEEKDISPIPTWDEALNYTFPNLDIKKNITLDFGALGKGYLIDIIGSLLENYGYKNFTIDAGGDILYKGNPEMTVGLENPLNTEQVIGVCKIQNSSICGSASNRRNWGKYHHIINPETLTSVENVIAVWVVAKDTILADGLSTCLFFVSPEVLKRDFDFEYLVLNSDFSINKSSNFPGEVFIS